MVNHGVAASSDPLIGRTIAGRFTITGLIARGGMGKVYRAVQAPLGRACALKVLDANLAEKDPDFHRRFFLEASTASKLTHPHTVTIIDYGRTADGVFFMAMELLNGTTLRRALNEQGAFSEERTTYIARQICRALAEAHGLGVIHRDLKPANIFLVSQGDESDFVKILDFGLVKNVGAEDMTETGVFMGSPKYMAPEQIQGGRLDARTDIYSLGVIMYEMLTGRAPFDRPHGVNILMAHVTEEVPALRAVNPSIEVSPRMEEIIRRCLSKDLEARFGSMDELNATLKGMAPSIPAPIASGALVPRPLESVPAKDSHVTLVTPKKRPPWAIAVFVAGALALIGATTFALFPRHASAPAPSSAAPVETAPPPPPETASAAAPAPEPAVARLRVTTDPPGAKVREDGVEVCSATPCDLVFQGREAEATREHTLLIARAGFSPAVRTIKVGDGAVTVKLTRPPRGAPPAPAPGRPAADPDINVAR